MILLKNFSVVALLVIATTQAQAQRPFSFFAIGDMPYHNPEDTAKFKKLTKAINRKRPAFTVHVGDIKNGSTKCSEEYYNTILTLFNQFRAPLVYTPGDNEWTDCNRPACGGYDPVERLKVLRRMYFNNDESLGQKKMKLQTQRDRPGFEEYVENAIWRRQGTTFGTLHVVGSNNNLKERKENSDQEFFKRDQANLYWLEEIFKTATIHQDAAIVMFMHAAMPFQKKDEHGFTNIITKLRTEVQNFKKPVLLIYGDHHEFLISKPLMDEEKNLIPNFTALMVYGDHDMNAVEIVVNPKSRQVFSFKEFVMEYQGGND